VHAGVRFTTVVDVVGHLRLAMGHQVESVLHLQGVALLARRAFGELGAIDDVPAPDAEERPLLEGPVGENAHTAAVLMAPSHQTVDEIAGLQPPCHDIPRSVTHDSRAPTLPHASTASTDGLTPCAGTQRPRSPPLASGKVGTFVLDCPRLVSFGIGQGASRCGEPGFAPQSIRKSVGHTVSEVPGNQVVGDLLAYSFRPPRPLARDRPGDRGNSVLPGRRWLLGAIGPGNRRPTRPVKSQ
jgi:hypothetical protein